MNWLLIIVLILLLVFAVRGWQKGFLQVLFSLVSIIVLIALAVWLAPQVTDFFIQKFGMGDGAAGKLLTILIAGIAAFIIVRLIAKALQLVNKIPVLGKVNQFFGLLAGLVEGLILVWIIMIGINFWVTINPNAAIASVIEGNEILFWLFENNPLTGFRHNI